MLMVYPIKSAYQRLEKEALEGLGVVEKLKAEKSDFPAITHADFSSRIQTVEANDHPRFHALLSAFHKQTGCPMLLNTSFNERGEPIVTTARDAFFAFMRTGIDVLVLENIVLEKSQVAHLDPADFEQVFDLD